MEKGFLGRLDKIEAMVNDVSTGKKCIMADFVATHEVVWKGKYLSPNGVICVGWYKTRAVASSIGVKNPTPVDTTTLHWDDIVEIIQSFEQVKDV